MSGKGVMAHHLMRASLARSGKRFDELAPEERSAVEKDAARSFEIETLVLESPEAATIVIPPKSLDQTVRDVESRYDTIEQFEQDLRQNNLTPETLRAALERELKVEAVLEKVAATGPVVTDEEVRVWYDDHPEKFDLPETRQVRHILITINDDYAENSRDEARRRIEDVRSRMDGSRERFHNLAHNHSECPTALEGGVIGRVPRGQLYPQIDEALFQMHEGGISDIVETVNGFHIVYCEKIHPAQFVGFEEAEPKIRAAFDKKRREVTQSRWLSALMQSRVESAVK